MILPFAAGSKFLKEKATPKIRAHWATRSQISLRNAVAFTKSWRQET